MDLTAFAARHALAVILIALVAVPAILAAMAVAMTGARTAREPRVIALATLALAACGAGVFIAIARRIAGGTPFAAADQRLLDAIREGVPLFAAPVFARLTHLGDPWFLALLCAFVCAALVLMRRIGLAVYLAAATSAGGLINHALKAAMRRERPGGALVPLPESFSFPSGHTFGSMVCYGMCAYVLMRLAPRRWDAIVVAAACMIVLLIGTSRVVIGVHFPGDVVGGFAAGGAWLALCVGVAECVRRTRP